MVLKCKEFECLVVFDGPEDYVLGQMVGHLKGTHGVNATVDSLKDIPPETREDKKIDVTPETVVGQPKSFTGKRGKKLKK